MTTAAAPPRAWRDGDHRLVAGVASGLAEHLGWSVGWTRAGFVILALFSGFGVVLYGALWAFLPLRPAEGGDPAPRDPGVLPLLAIGMLVLGGALLLPAVLGFAPAAYVVPLIVLGIGAAVVWQQVDDEQRRRWTDAAVGRSDEGSVRWWRLAAGLLLVVAGAALLLVDVTSAADALAAMVIGLLFALGLGLLALPWLRQQWQTAQQERAARIRERERAELAAAVHDSVLQTLTLIRSNAADADAVQRLARAEERRLRTWLYAPVGSPEENWRAALESAAARVEGQQAASVDVVTVGDAALSPELGPLLAAATEAMVNAAKHAGGSVSVYSEVEPEQVAVFVKDRGGGFDPEKVPAGRHGIRESIVGRMQRNGGRAEIRSTGSGTEVRLFMPREGT